MAKYRGSKKERLTTRIWRSRLAREKGARCSTPLTLKYKLFRARSDRGGGGTPISILERDDEGYYNTIGVYNSEDEAVEALAKLMGLEI